LNKFKRLFAALIGQAPGRVPTLSPTITVLPLIEICSIEKQRKSRLRDKRLFFLLFAWSFS
jgi:hypothetical protein